MQKVNQMSKKELIRQLNQNIDEYIDIELEIELIDKKNFKPIK